MGGVLLKIIIDHFNAFFYVFITFVVYKMAIIILIFNKLKIVILLEILNAKKIRDYTFNRVIPLIIIFIYLRHVIYIV